MSVKQQHTRLRTLGKGCSIESARDKKSETEIAIDLQLINEKIASGSKPKVILKVEEK